jgi:heme oxygenase
MKNQDNNLLTLLKNDTKYWHTEAEKVGFAQELANEQIDKNSYTKWLLLNYWFHSKCEIDFNKLPENWKQDFEVAKRKKTQHLLKDLLFLLGKNITERPTIQAEINNHYELLGVLYVCEGSTLGLQFIKKNILKSIQQLQLTTHYLDVYAPQEVGILWKSFGDNLLKVATEEHQKQAVLQGAVKAFQNFIEYANYLNNKKMA